MFPLHVLLVLLTLFASAAAVQEYLDENELIEALGVYRKIPRQVGPIVNIRKALPFLGF